MISIDYLLIVNYNDDALIKQNIYKGGVTHAEI